MADPRIGVARQDDHAAQCEGAMILAGLLYPRAGVVIGAPCGERRGREGRTGAVQRYSQVSGSRSRWPQMTYLSVLRDRWDVPSHR